MEYQQATHMAPVDRQETNERMFNRKLINGYIDQEIRNNPDSEHKVQYGVDLLKNWLEGEYHESKQKRLAQLALLDLEKLVRSIFVQMAYYISPETYVSATSQLANMLGFANHRHSITTIAEIVAVLGHTDAFDIIKEDRFASLMVQSRLSMHPNIQDAIRRSLYLPPMVCKPKPVLSNYESAYLLNKSDCLVLGSGNGHDGDLCLDVINLQNQIALKLDTHFLSTVEEVPNKEFHTAEEEHNWDIFKQESYAIYDMLTRQENQFWLTHKVDKRGRMYAQGYHVNSQGSAFKKAMLELHNEEIVEGVPE